MCAAIARARVGAGGEDRLERELVGAQLGVALAHGREIVDHGGRDGSLELAVARRRELRFDSRGLDAADCREDVDQVADAGLRGVAADLAAGVGYGALELLLDRPGSSST